MTLFDEDLDLRGCTVLLQGPFVDGKISVINIPQESERLCRLGYVAYVWGPDGWKRSVFQRVGEDVRITPDDIVSVLPNEECSTFLNTTTEDAPAAITPPASGGNTMTTFDPDLDLRGRTVRLRGRGDNGEGPVVRIPTSSRRCKLQGVITYIWTDLQSEEYVVAFQDNQDNGSSRTEDDIVEVLSEDVTLAPQSYRFRARRYRDIDLGRIARDIGDAPYATVEWGDQSVVIVGNLAMRRSAEASHVPTGGCVGRGLAIDADGNLISSLSTSSVTGWHGPDAQAHAAEWWAEVRRRERPEVIVSVTPAS